MDDLKRAFNFVTGSALGIFLAIGAGLILCGLGCVVCSLLSAQFDELTPPAGALILWLM